MNIQSVLRRVAFTGVFLLGIGAAQRADAATFAVTNTNPSGAGSLRRAVLDANDAPSDDIITFNIPTNTIAVSGALPIANNGSLLIDGTGARRPLLDGGGTSGLFVVRPGANVTLKAFAITRALESAVTNQAGTLTIEGVDFYSNSAANRQGGAGFGGAINNLGGTVRVTNSTFSDNVAGPGISGGGGAISSTGTVLVSRCSFLSNTSGAGGAVYNNGGTVRVDNSTFFANRGSAFFVNNTELLIESCTLTQNSGNNGGAIFRNAGSLTLHSSIVAGNTNLNGSLDNISGAVTAGDYNLIDNTTGTTLSGTHDIVSTTPKLGELGDHGGPTQTVALLPGSPAIDAGNTALTTDQRGVARPQRSAPDIGAFEVINTAPQFTSLTLGPAAPKTDGTLTAIPMSTDADGDTPIYTYVWRKNGGVIEGESGAILDLSKPGNGDLGDAITVTAMVSDGFATGEPISSGVVYVEDFTPSVVSLSPQGGADRVGNKRTFTLTVSDFDGANDIREAWLLINDRLSWNAGATLIYVPDAGTPTNGLLYLRQGDAFLPTMRIGTGATAGAVLDNGAVRVIGSEVAVNVGNDSKTLILSLPLTIREGLVGQNRLFARVVDRQGVLDALSEAGDDGYRRYGNYTVTPPFPTATNSAPTLSKLNPANTNTVLNSAGIAPAPQNFGFFVKDENGWGDIDNVWFLAGQVRSFRFTANFVFYPRTRRLFIRSDDGTTLLGGGRIGSTGILENSQVRLDLSKVKMTIVDDKSFGLTLPIQAKSRLFGPNKVWLRVQDNQRATAPNGDYEGYVLGGTWNVTQGTTPRSTNSISAGGS
ncbi:right-handed parallel beta-helix repeat-containing protein [bacterium]|nr:MAG: right-handed parallel beta-helix repeat-containing protein [bacterium]